MCIALCCDVCDGTYMRPTGNNFEFEPITEMMVCDVTGVSVIVVRLSRLLRASSTALLRERKRLKLLEMALKRRLKIQLDVIYVVSRNKLN